MPVLSPIVLMNTIYTLVDSFRDSSNAIAKLIIRIGFDSSQYEYGAAMGWVYFVLVLSMVGLILLLSRRFVSHDR